LLLYSVVVVVVVAVVTVVVVVVVVVMAVVVVVVVVVVAVVTVVVVVAVVTVVVVVVVVVVAVIFSLNFFNNAFVSVRSIIGQRTYHKLLTLDNYKMTTYCRRSVDTAQVASEGSGRLTKPAIATIK